MQALNNTMATFQWTVRLLDGTRLFPASWATSRRTSPRSRALQHRRSTLRRQLEHTHTNLYHPLPQAREPPSQGDQPTIYWEIVAWILHVIGGTWRLAVQQMQPAPTTIEQHAYSWEPSPWPLLIWEYIPVHSHRTVPMNRANAIAAGSTGFPLHPHPRQLCAIPAPNLGAGRDSAAPSSPPTRPTRRSRSPMPANEATRADVPDAPEETFLAVDQHQTLAQRLREHLATSPRRQRRRYYRRRLNSSDDEVGIESVTEASTPEGRASSSEASPTFSIA